MTPMNAASLLDNARDSYATGLAAQAAQKAAAKAGPAALAGAQMPADQEKKVRGAAQEFEAFFIGQMMEHMMAGLETDPLFGGGHGEQMWRSMLNQEYGKELAKSGRLGIADHVMRGMLAAQEERDAAAAGTAAPARKAQAKTGGELQEISQAPVFMPIRR